MKRIELGQISTDIGSGRKCKVLAASSADATKLIVEFQDDFSVGTVFTVALIPDTPKPDEWISVAKQDSFRPPVYITTPVDFFVYHKRAHAATLIFSLRQEPALTTTFTVKDGIERKFEVVVLDKSKRLFSCSCTDYMEDRAGYCLHTAVVENVIDDCYRLIVDSHVRKAFLKSLRPKGGIKQVKIISYDSLKEGLIELGDLQSTRVIKTAAAEAFETQRRLSLPMSQPLEIEHPNIIPGVDLFDYQKNCIVKMLGIKKMIVAMAMGLGKTMTSIAAYMHIMSNQNRDLKVLVVCPKTLKSQWIIEMQRCAGKTAIDIDSTTRLAEFLPLEAGIGTITYQLFSKNAEAFANAKFDIIIADEIQFIRNDESKAWKAFKGAKADYFWGLSGTVIENRIDDLYSIMEVIAPGYLGPKWKFEYKYKDILSINYKKLNYANSFKNQADLIELISPYVFSYSKASLSNNLTVNKIKCKMSDEALAQHNGFMQQAKALLAKGMSGGLSFAEKRMVQALMLKARQTANSLELITKEYEPPSNKLKAFLDLVKQICIKDGQKLVVFSEWTQMLDILEREQSKKFGLKGVRLDGSMSVAARAKSIQRFRTESDCMLFFSSEAGGLGVDGLQTAAHNIVHIELPWNPSRLDQRSGRLNRLGQTKPVNSYILISQDTIEERIEILLDAKRSIRMEALFT